MSVATSPAPAPTFVAPPGKRSRKRKVLTVAGIVLVLIAVLGAGTYALVGSATKDAQKVSDRFVRAIERGDGAAAYALANPDFKKAATEQQLDGLADQLKPLVTGTPALKARAISVRTGTGKVAVFVYDLKPTSGSTVHFKTQLRKQDGTWRVMNFRSSRSKLTADVE